ncbi:histone deacetylase 6-like isoform X1 [Sinocyclocheilus rhinocerous]|uniref:histone deacetylase 6-like isoform X1 n=1 Tax=Sinocyclocheilus rhinocerous TaxID=307959 RepID=UPI0007B91061|nr:PREDICTED: histone deacetylase 6-like isoform X1 [Sinocyclocheilus rhinocerous]XP_016392782.1 PREDICTED: histone deacetylase 6-like isoform X1 [Sinocyclocheilus rhinocerous]
MDPVPDSKGSTRSPRGTSETKRENNNPNQKKNLQEARRKGRMDRSKEEEEMSNELKNLDVRGKTKATGTGLVYVDAFTRFHCLWDASHPECPARVSAVMEMLETEGLLGRCVQVEARAVSEDELLLVHTKAYVELMKSTQKMTEEELKTLAHKYDSVYLHPEFFASACLAVGSVLQLVDKVMTSQLRNGFSINRPPGHHAHADKMNGYCMFNNLAIAARYAQKQHGVKRVLIVDWDVHHGQGIQYIFEEDPSVLYFSVHRYEDGSFWPHLKESDSSSVGSGAGQGYNINLPWNKIGMEDGDYVTAFQQLLLPVAYEFQPQLVLVAAGFDSVIGDPKGEMRVSPQCFSILTHMLKGVAQGRLVLALEGGYNLQSTAEGVCASVRSLLGDPCPHLTSPGDPSESALKSISESISALYPFWKSLQTFEGGPLSDVTPLPAPVCAEVKVSSPITGLVYDQRMMLHHNMWDGHHPELPQRISRIFCRHEELGLLSRCLQIPARLATEEELALCHSSEHISTIKSTEHMKPRDLHRLGNDYNSIYICNESYTCALMAAGSCFNSVQAIITGHVRNGVAIVRPPGHHAEKDTACGFCFFNTAALTARYAQSITHESLRVLILDWDVHHGNGTQHIFEEDDSVLYISLHRYEDGTFFPSSEDANYDKVGQGKGTGYNVNIPWNGGKMGDPEYMAAFHHIVMPIAREFAPELVLVSAGFDAARGDPLGGYQVTPEGYAHLTHQLMSLAAGRVLVILEGGYNLTSISESMSMCTSMLLGDSPPSLDHLPPPKTSATVTINNVLRAHVPFWSSLRIQIPESLRLALPSPKSKGKRASAGKSKKSPRQSTQSPGQTPQHLEESGLDELSKDLLSLNLNTSTSSNPSPASVPIGGARRKVKPNPQRDSAGRESDSPLKLKSEKARVGDGTHAEITAVKAETPDRTIPESVVSGKSAAVDDQESSVLEAAGGHTTMMSVLQSVFGAQATDLDTMYVVDPLSWCPHLESVRPVPAGGIDVFLPCEECGGDTENWICLFCHKVLCGRYVKQHMVTHGQVSGHPMVLSFADLSVWCYACESYVHNKVLHEAKSAAHLVKFGEEIPPFS